MQYTFMLMMKSTTKVTGPAKTFPDFISFFYTLGLEIAVLDPSLLCKAERGFGRKCRVKEKGGKKR